MTASRNGRRGRKRRSSSLDKKDEPGKRPTLADVPLSEQTTYWVPYAVQLVVSAVEVAPASQPEAMR